MRHLFQFDPQTSFLTATVVGAVLAVAALVGRSRQRVRYPGSILWIFAILLGAAGSFLGYVRTDTTNFLVIFAMNALFFFVVPFIHLGSRRFFGASVTAVDYSVLAPFAAALVLYLFREPLSLGVRERIIVSSVALIATVAIALARSPASARPYVGRFVLLSAYATAILRAVVRSIGATTAAAPFDYFAPEFWNLASFALLFILVLLVDLAVVMLLWERSVLDEHELAGQNELLIHEVHHRVKNNLLMLETLIDLKDTELADAADLSDLRRQVNVVAKLHARMQDCEPLATVPLGPYLSDVLDTIFTDQSDYDVVVEKQIDEIDLTGRDAVTVGLLVNELASNAREHGFDRDAPNRFILSASREPEFGHLKLVVRNTGRRFPDDVDISTSPSLGLRLVSAFVRQYDGQIVLEREPETTITVSLNVQ